MTQVARPTPGVDAEGRPSTSGVGAGQRSTGRLAHVQALRALAVGGVLLFHLWPAALPGGFVGVDIFFVISGFLITGGIVRGLEKRQFSFREFYVRRVRRLIPAAALVALVSGVVAALVQPVSLWLDTFSELLAATLYVQNWTLASTRRPLHPRSGRAGYRSDGSRLEIDTTLLVESNRSP